MTNIIGIIETSLLPIIVISCMIDITKITIITSITTKTTIITIIKTNSKSKVEV